MRCVGSNPTCSATRNSKHSWYCYGLLIRSSSNRCVGSSPIYSAILTFRSPWQNHPVMILYECVEQVFWYCEVEQSGSSSDSYSECRGFKSHPRYQEERLHFAECETMKTSLDNLEETSTKVYIGLCKESLHQIPLIMELSLVRVQQSPPWGLTSDGRGLIDTFLFFSL